MTGPVSQRSDSGAEWATLVERIAGGDEQALGELYDATRRLIYGVALRMVRDPIVAEEVTLEVYMQIWRTAATYSSKRGAVLSWMLTVVRSRAIDRIRARAARAAKEGSLDAAFDVSDPAPTPEEMALESGQARTVRLGLDNLPAEERRIIELAYFGGLSHSEIAEKTSLPLGTVKTRIRVGMLRLKDILNPAEQGAV